jgi:hypothetical protein
MHGYEDISIYLPKLTVFPRSEERMAEQTVCTGPNTDTNSGLFFPRHHV